MDISWRMKCATPWCELYLTLDLVIVTLSLKILPGLSLRNYFVGEVDIGILVRGCRCAISWCVFDLTLAVPYLRHISLTTKIYGLVIINLIFTFTFYFD